MHWTGLAILLALGLFAAWTLLTVYTLWLLTHPPRRGYAFAVARGLPGDPSELIVPGRGHTPFTEWTFTSHGAALPVWDIPADDPRGPIVILVHGWADSRVTSLQRVPALLAGASRVLIPELPGHGDAPGICRLGAREHEDVLALIDTLGHGDDPVRYPIVVMGFSMGAGIALAAAAASARISSVVAEAPYRLPFTPARNVLALRGLPWRSNLPPALVLLGLAFARTASWASNSRAPIFDRARLVERCPQSILILHAGEDEVSPIEDSRAIAVAAADATLIEIPGSGHADLWTDPRSYALCARAVHDFLGKFTMDGEQGPLSGTGAGASGPLRPLE